MDQKLLLHAVAWNPGILESSNASSAYPARIFAKRVSRRVKWRGNFFGRHVREKRKRIKQITVHGSAPRKPVPAQKCLLSGAVRNWGEVGGTQAELAAIHVTSLCGAQRKVETFAILLLFVIEFGIITSLVMLY